MRTFDANRLPRHLRGQGAVRSISDIAFMDAGQYGLAAACNNGQVRHRQEDRMQDQSVRCVILEPAIRRA